MDKHKEQPGHSVEEMYSIVRHAHTWRGLFSTERRGEEEKRAGHKNEVNVSTEKMRFCICTAEIMMLSVSQPLSIMPV